MQYEAKQPGHLKRPIILFIVGIGVFAVGITTLFVVIQALLPSSGSWRPYVAALPGIGLCTSLIPVYLYLRHHDELEKRNGIQSLAVSAICAIVILVVSVSRAAIGGYVELNGSLILVVMGSSFAAALLFFTWRNR